MSIKIKRIYEAASGDDGVRVLVDRLWPRGISKKDARLDYWLKNIGPASELRKSFHQDKMNFSTFKKRYKEEQLRNGEQLEELEKLRDIVDEHTIVTLLFAAKDEENNQAVILQEILKDER
ncbi:DUF488 domain-containing protein [Oceanobacillus zhaokaii]|uniref:DUF488 domain-containing protein n=1 Tax=Oceanobacillus zhaokaii TaxID=2052660 RepID=A0A345PL05_9BACI|nr:DUF488 family protein [Oceanobacillus zhaokaii]AXI10685.1 DUF488 domain-containing protein [Oceanobacillus zhaokaii]